MKQVLLQEKYPVFYLEIERKETTFKSAKEIITYLKEKIEAHELAQFIATFDHYGHTRSLPSGEISPDILDAQNIVFCFGIKLPNPHVLAVRPRSIGVCELADRFVISFLEAPMPIANTAMEQWARSLRNVEIAQATA